MIISEYKDSYFGDVMILIHKFHEDSLGEYGFKISDDVSRGTFEACKKDSLFLVCNGKVVGVIGGVVSHAVMDDQPIWNELIWYIDRDYRGSGGMLYRAMEDKLRAKGIKQMIMVAMENSSKAILDKVYKGLGYKPFETQYIKLLEN